MFHVERWEGPVALNFTKEETEKFLLWIALRIAEVKDLLFFASFAPLRLEETRIEGIHDRKDAKDAKKTKKGLAPADFSDFLCVLCVFAVKNLRFETSIAESPRASAPKITNSVLLDKNTT